MKEKKMPLTTQSGDVHMPYMAKQLQKKIYAHTEICA